MDDDLVYCNNIQELKEELQIERAPEQWRLFIDLSKGSWKSVLCHNGNKFYPTGSCSSHERNVWEPSGFAAKNVLWRTRVEYVCWPEGSGNADWAARQVHKILLLNVWLGLPSKRLVQWNKKKWPLHSETAPGQKNVAHPALVDRSKIYLPPLHIKNIFESDR